MTWIFLDSFASELEANLAKDKLQSQGIECHTRLSPRGDTMLAAFGTLTGPTVVLVDEKDAERARQILS